MMKKGGMENEKRWKERRNRREKERQTQTQRERKTYKQTARQGQMEQIHRAGRYGGRERGLDGGRDWDGWASELV